MKTVNEYQKQFQTWQLEYEAKKNQADRLFSRISTFRIVTFLLGAAGVIIGITEKEKSYAPALTVLGLLLLAGFVALVRWHGVVAERQQLLADKWEVCKRYTARYSDAWRKFEENGTTYKKESDCVAEDIDLLGENSLYQMLSVCHTEKGKVRFAESLTTRYVDEEQRENRYAAIMELADHPEFAVEFETAGRRLEEEQGKFDAEKFEQFCTDDRLGKLPAFAHIARIVLPAAELVSLVLCLGGAISYGYPLAGFLILLVFSWLTKAKTDEVILPAYYASAVSGEYTAMLSLLALSKFESGLLASMQKKTGGSEGAWMAFRKLKTISQAYNISFNPLVHQILCGFFLWDYQLAAVVTRWKRKYGQNVAGCSDMIAQMEELLSFAVLGMVRKTGESEVLYESRGQGGKETGVILSGEDLYHPLLAIDTAQANSVTLKSGITIITGSNMSGKTTFLRTIAVNLVLAYLGAPVCAGRLRASYMKLFTSMRVRDDVAHGISTFYAEILRIKEMADYRKENKPMLCLIDEIFKGTNSADRIVGAKEVITTLAGKNCMTVVSTHDFELCSITDKRGTPAENYHFQEYYEGDELKFDYRIRDGRCTTTNARAILRMAGFDVEQEQNPGTMPTVL